VASLPTPAGSEPSRMMMLNNWDVKFAPPARWKAEDGIDRATHCQDDVASLRSSPLWTTLITDVVSDCLNVVDHVRTTRSAATSFFEVAASTSQTTHLGSQTIFDDQ